MADCLHMNFAARVAVNRLSEIEGGSVTGYSADVRIRCAECHRPFQFVGMSPGSSQSQPMVSIDALEARMPIAPAGTVPSPLHRIAGAREHFDA